MSIKVISDMGGHMKKVSDKASSINLVHSTAENSKKISDRKDAMSSIIGVSRSKDMADKKTKLTHGTCKKSDYYCQEKDDGSLWLYVDTRKMKVSFCPYCGYMAKA